MFCHSSVSFSCFPFLPIPSFVGTRPSLLYTTHLNHGGLTTDLTIQPILPTGAINYTMAIYQYNNKTQILTLLATRSGTARDTIVFTVPAPIGKNDHVHIKHTHGKT
jgi:hypothetical protein